MHTKGDWYKCQDALVRGLRSSWWEWDDGSAPFFWRWPEDYKNAIRDGVAFPFSREPPRYLTPQRETPDKQRRAMVVEKLEQVLGRRYLGPGVIKSLTAFFDVDKVKEGNKVMDIRMVYDGTISGFNDSLEVPKFGLPTLRSHLRAMEPG